MLKMADKFMVYLGIAVMTISIGFGSLFFIYPRIGWNFAMTAFIWTIGAIATILGLTIFSKEEEYVAS